MKTLELKVPSKGEFVNNFADVASEGGEEGGRALHKILRVYRELKGIYSWDVETEELTRVQESEGVGVGEYMARMHLPRKWSDLVLCAYAGQFPFQFLSGEETQEGVLRVFEKDGKKQYVIVNGAKLLEQ